MPEDVSFEFGALRIRARRIHCFTLDAVAVEDHYAHRHSSHLYALCRGLPEDIATNAPLRRAFEAALEKRMQVRRDEFAGQNPVGRPQGEMAFGIVQLGLSAASLRNADVCGEVLRWLVGNYWSPNLVSTHNIHAIFNTDQCGGLPAFLIRTLVDSQPGWMDLLPAQPKDLPKGKIAGVRYRGQVELREMAWRPDEISATFLSAVDQEVEVRFPSGARKLALAAARRSR